MKIVLLAGGISNEKEVSIRSGNTIEVALAEAGYEVIRANPADKGFDLKKLSLEADMVFPVLHGEGGEDGSLQEQLENLNIPFLGSTSGVCRKTFNKVEYKKLLEQHHILIPRWQEVTKDTFYTSKLCNQPFVLKPIQGGSSIDTFVVQNSSSQAVNLIEPLTKYGSMLLEECIKGQEITVGILGEKALPVILIIPPKNEEFNYENKYNGTSQEIPNPKQIPLPIQEEAQQLALKIHRLVGCRHFSRTDMILTSDGSLYTLETNTIPGLTKESLFPKAAAADDINATELARQLVALVQNGK